jgi:thiamine pyrophosphokinase
VPVASRAALVFAAAPVAVTPRLRTRLGALDDPYVVAADGGASTALRFGYRPHVVVGDMDSLDRSSLADLPAEIHPREKDVTDGQLAIQRALRMRPAQLLLVGFLGGPRLDQALANVLLLAELDIAAVLLDEHNECILLRGAAEHVWRPEPDEVISLIPLDREVTGVRAEGVRWPLAGERLRFGDTRSISNEPIAERVGVSLTGGLLLLARYFPGTGL